MATEKQIEYINILVEQREVPEGFTADSVAEMTTEEASAQIRKFLSQPLKEGSTAATERDLIGSVGEGIYTLTAKQAATVLNYKGEPYFGAEKITLKVNRTKEDKFWLEVTKPVAHPVKDSTARRSIMLLLAKKTPKA
jgi:hypothetical protein